MTMEPGMSVMGISGHEVVPLPGPFIAMFPPQAKADLMAELDFHEGEEMTTATTGGSKGTKLARFDLIPATPLFLLAKLFGIGAKKYEIRNWERGYEWSKSFGALMRHAWAFWAGETTDPESGLPHMTHVAWHALAMVEWLGTHPEFDDRPSIKAAEIEDKIADVAKGLSGYR